MGISAAVSGTSPLFFKKPDFKSCKHTQCCCLNLWKWWINRSWGISGCGALAGWLVMAVQDGPTFPFAGSKDLEAAGRCRSNSICSEMFDHSPSEQKWVMAARNTSHISKSTELWNLWWAFLTGTLEVDNELLLKIDQVFAALLISEAWLQLLPLAAFVLMRLIWGEPRLSQIEQHIEYSMHQQRASWAVFKPSWENLTDLSCQINICA